jgi:alkylation response protein AidB-like acyl-CoA dehydrogenase
VPESLSPELNDLRVVAAKLATEHLIVLRDEAHLTAADRAARVCRASKAAGIYSLTQSNTNSALTLLVARETLAAHGVGHMQGVFGASADLLEQVAEPLRSSHLLPLLAGDKRGGFAFTEPSNAPRPTWARVDGDELVINGQKSYVTGGADASFLTALVEIEGQGPSMVIIDTHHTGVTLSRQFTSLDGSHHAAFHFNEVRVPRHHAIGAPGDGRSRALDKISVLRRAVAADCVGSSAWILGIVADDLRQQRRSGTKGDFERVRLRFGEMRIAAYAARSMVYRTARLADAGDNVVNETIAAKVFASETANQIADMAIQLLGGEALVAGHPLEAAYRRLRAMRLVEGESDTLRVNLSRGFLDLGKGRI